MRSARGRIGGTQPTITTIHASVEAQISRGERASREKCVGALYKKEMMEMRESEQMGQGGIDGSYR